MWTGRSISVMGPEGTTKTQPEGLIELWPQVAYVLYVIFGELTKHECLPCYVFMCFNYFRG